MAIRVTASDVRTLGKFPASVSDAELDAAIAIATLLVDDIVALGKTCMPEGPKATQLEKMLAAHYAAIANPKLISKSIAGASSTFEGSASGDGFASTRFGVQALSFDCTKHLQKLEAPSVGLTWLGTENT